MLFFSLFGILSFKKLFLKKKKGESTFHGMSTLENTHISFFQNKKMLYGYLFKKNNGILKKYIPGQLAGDLGHRSVRIQSPP